MRVYFAPMEGITGFLYRKAHHRHFGGADRYYMPFLSPSGDHVFTKRDLREIAPENNRDIDVVPQLLTRHSADFIWAAGELETRGYSEVNLNLGCPSGTVTAKGKGAGLLAFPEELDRFLEEIFSGTKLRVSVKTRLGMTRPDEFEELLSVYEKYPISELIIHARVRADFYKYPARMEAFDGLAGRTRSSLCYNGDLVTEEDCRRFERGHPGVEAVMLGRGLVADPALARKVHGGRGAAKKELQEFCDELYESYAAAFGSKHNAMLRMKELWSYQIGLFEEGETYGKRLRKASDSTCFEDVVRSLFQDLELRGHAVPVW